MQTIPHYLIETNRKMKEGIHIELHFRAAEPKDVEDAHRLIYSAGVEGFDYVFEQKDIKALDFMRYAFLEGSGFFGYRVHVVAELDSRVVGIGSFYSGHEYNAMSMGTGKQLFKFYGIRNLLPVTIRSYYAMSLTPPPKKDMEYVADLGVAEDMRGKGIGSALLNHQKEVARRKNRRVYALDVALDNPRAQKLYERFGFKVTGLNRFRGSRKAPHIADTRRMEILL